MNKFKKFALLLMVVCLGCVFASCSEFFTPLPEDFFINEETSESVVEPPFDEETTDPNSSEVIPPTEDNTEELPPAEEVVEPIVSQALVFTEGTHVVENLSITCNENDRAAIYAEGAGTVVVINSGTYYGGTDGSSAPAVYARDGAKIIINGGTFGTGEGNATVYAKNYAYVEINGGKFSADGAWEGKYYVLNLADNTNSNILVYGGEFKNFDPSNAETEPEIKSFVAEGYEVSIVEEDGVWYFVKIIEVVEQI